MPRSRHPAGELALIERIRSRAAQIQGRAVKLGIGDDCAILAPRPGQDLLITTDFSLEGRHFRRDWHSPQSIGHRTLARGLSDLTAMGAAPMAAFLSLALPKSAADNTTWLDGFLDGLLALAEQHNVQLAGGDTSESPSDHILADIVLLGSAPTGRALRRSSAKPGDLLYITGALGGAAAELASISTNPKPPSSRPNAAHFAASPTPSSRLNAALFTASATPSSRLKAAHFAATSTPSSRPEAVHFAATPTPSSRPEAVHFAATPTPSSRPEAAHFAAAVERPLYFARSANHPHLFPQPRLAVGQALLRRRLASACIDTSDGLSTDLTHLCTASGVAAELDIALLPAHPLTANLDDAAQITAILHGGEDYELLFTAPAATRMPRSIAGVPITQIGRILKPRKDRAQITLLSEGTRFDLAPQGWEHLK